MTFPSGSPYDMTQNEKNQLTPVWLRKRAKLTQRIASHLIGVTEKTLSEWERGVRSPNLSHAPKMMEVYNCTADELIQAFVNLRPEHSEAEANGSE